MKLLNRIVKALLYPPTWLAFLIVFPSFALLLYVFLQGINDTWLTYVSYGCSAYSLVIIAMRVPGIIHAFQTDFENHPMIRRAIESPMGTRLRADASYRAELGLYAGLTTNLLYAAVKMISGILFHSIWFGVMAGYYFLLAVMRFSLLHHINQNAAAQQMLSGWKRYRLCGGVLLLMNHALSLVVFWVVQKNSGVVYPGYLVYAIAAYTFYAVINAVRNIVNDKYQSSPVMMAARMVNLIAALVSLLSLETALLTQFGSEDEAMFRQIVTAATGTVVCLTVLAMAIYMLIRSTKQIKKLQQGAE